MYLSCLAMVFSESMYGKPFIQQITITYLCKSKGKKNERIKVGIKAKIYL